MVGQNEYFEMSFGQGWRFRLPFMLFIIVPFLLFDKMTCLAICWENFTPTLDEFLVLVSWGFEQSISIKNQKSIISTWISFIFFCYVPKNCCPTKCSILCEKLLHLQRKNIILEKSIFAKFVKVVPEILPSGQHVTKI